MTTRNGSHSVSKIVNALYANIKRILLLIHSFSGCDTVSSIHGLGKVTILKKALYFHEEGHLASLLSVRVPTNEVIAAGLFCFMEIKPSHLKLSDFSATVEHHLQLNIK